MSRRPPPRADVAAREVEQLRRENHDLGNQLKQLVRAERRLSISQQVQDEQLQRVEGLNALALAASRAEDACEILGLTLDALFSMFVFEQAIGVLLDDDGTPIRCVVRAVPGREGIGGSGPAIDLRAARPPPPLSPRELPRPLLCGAAEIRAHHPALRRLLELVEATFQGPAGLREGEPSYLVLPLSPKSDALCAVLFLRRSTGSLSFVERLPGPQDLAFLQLLGGHAASAVQGLALVQGARTAAEEARRHARRMQALAEASRALASLDEKAVLDAIARRASDAIGGTCAIRLPSGDGELLVATAICAAPGDVPSPPPLRVREPWLGSVFRDGSALSLAAGDAHLEAVAASVAGATAHVGGLLLSPMRLGERIVGLLQMTHPEGTAYTHDDEVFLRDLGDRAAQALENARLYRESQEAIRLRDEFLSVASHELRTPLTALFAHAHMLRGPGGDPGGATATHAAAIERQAQRLARLIEELLDVSRIRVGWLELVLSDVDLCELAQTVATRLHEERSFAGARIAVTCPSAVRVECDRERVEQVLGNLIANAIKFGEGRSIEVEVDRAPPWARLRVRDHGIGIAPATQARLFDPFERGVSDRHYGGLGLGLYIARRVVEAHGGTIGVESQPGEGSTFTVALPLEAVRSE